MPTNQEIYNAILKHMDDSGVAYANWYVGIATDPRARLFTDHNVDEAGGTWIFRDAGSDGNARAIEKFIIDTHKTKGDTGGGDTTTRYVYAYVITGTTKE